MLLTASSFATLLLAFPVQILVARYLGPDDLGIYAYALSFSVFARSFVTLGLQDALIPMYKAERDDSLFGTGILMRKVAALFLTTLPLIWLGVCRYRGDLHGVKLSWMLLIVIGAYLFSDFELYSVWCKSEGRLKNVVAVDFGGTVAGLTMRLTILWLRGSMYWLLGSYLFEQVAKQLIALYLYLRQSRPFLNPFSFRLGQVRPISARAWPIWLSAILAVAYARVDQILMGNILNPSHLGQYSVSYRMVEALASGAPALFIVYFPILSASSVQDFGRILQRMHDLAVVISLITVVPLYFAMEPIVLFLYGSKYGEAAKLVSLYIVVLPTFYFGYCRSAFLYSRGLQKSELVIRVISVTLSIGSNLYLLPRFGAVGAVWTALAVQWLMLLLPNIAIRELRPLWTSLAKAAFLPGSIARLYRWLKL